MKTYEIEVVETLSKVIKVEARNKEDALLMVKDLYDASAVILDSNDMVGGPEFNILD